MAIEVELGTEVEAWSGNSGLPIPLGDWITEIESVKETESSNHNPQLEIEWRIVEGQHRGATSREWLVVTPNTLGKVKAFLEAVSYPIPPGKFQLPTTALVGRRALTVWREDTTYDSKIKCFGHSRVPTATGGEDIPFDTAGLPEPVAPPQDEALPF